LFIYTTHITPRLEYVVNFLQQVFTRPVKVVTTIDEQASNCVVINYSTEELSFPCFIIRPHGLLSETGVREQNIQCSVSNDLTIFFETAGDFPFDIFTATFYLLSRYEEYLLYTPDQFGRYPHQASLAFQQNFLNQPLVNKWWQLFTRVVQEKLSVTLATDKQFIFLPTYDIDIAWSYKHKGFWRNTGGFFRDLLKGRFKQVSERIQVLRGRLRDPFDAYGWLNQLHEKHNLKPYYFFLLAHQPTAYEKNIAPGNKALQALIQDHLIRYPVGIHPSWKSSLDISVMQQEIQTLTAIAGKPVQASRQHYIKLTLPATYRQLLQEGIRYEFSMGYGSINGFRASVASPFYWYDLEQEQQTELLLFPFCFMDANAYYEQHNTPEAALTEMQHLYRSVKAVNGLFSILWHNNFLGTDPAFTGWKEIYEAFLQWQEAENKTTG
jgi:hypothetical protein